MSTNKAQYGPEYQAHLLEQYKLYVEMADRVSQRRMDTNKFFISIHTFMITLMSLFSKGNTAVLMLAAVMGMLFSGAWYFLLKSYRQLNSGKFKVVHDMEAELPYNPYDAEWDKLERGKNKKLYWPLSHLEVVLPAIFLLLYLVFLIYLAYCVKNGIAIPIGSVQDLPVGSADAG